MNIIKMLYYNTIDVSEIIDINKTIIWKGFKLQPNACSGCYDVLNAYVP